MIHLTRYISKSSSGILLCILLLISSHDVRASAPEKFHVHLNQPIYLAGETIWYKIYNTNYHTLQDHSSIVYVNLHDQNGKLLLQQKQKLNEGIADGSLDIPISFDENYYYLTCFTRWNMKFANAELTCIRIPVFDPFQNSLPSLDAGPSIVRQDSLSASSQIEIQLDQDIYTRRDQVEAVMTSPEGIDYQLSVSVHALDHLFPGAAPLKGVSYEPINQTSMETSLMMEGNITDPETNQPVISNVLSIYKVGTADFIKANTQTGMIQIPLEAYDGSTRFQIFNLNPYQHPIPGFSSSPAGEYLEGVEIRNLKRNSTIDRYIRDVRVDQKVKEIFYASELDSMQMKAYKRIDLKPDKIYQMEKYQNMTTFEEFLREVVVYARMIKEHDQVTVRLKNRETNREFMEKPWYLVDGYLTRDEQTVLAIPFKNLKRVEIFYTNKSIRAQLEPVMVRSGLLVIYTNDNYLAQQFGKQKNIIEVAGFSPARDFEIAPIPKANPRESPCFMPTLYWNANVNLTERTSFTFNTSDLMGEYVIQVEGMAENGQIIEASKIFTVGY